MPQNLVTKAKMVMTTKTALKSRSELAADLAVAAFTSLSSSTSEDAPSFVFLVEGPTFRWRRVPWGVDVVAMAGRLGDSRQCQSGRRDERIGTGIAFHDGQARRAHPRYANQWREVGQSNRRTRGLDLGLPRQSRNNAVPGLVGTRPEMEHRDKKKERLRTVAKVEEVEEKGRH